MKIFAILLSFMIVFGAVVLSQEEEKPVVVKQVAPYYPQKVKEKHILGIPKYLISTFFRFTFRII